MTEDFNAPYYFGGNLTPEMRETTITNAAKKYGEFLTEMGFDWVNDPNMADTPRRVAKAYVDDLWQGVYTPPPKITTFPNETGYDGMVFSGAIEVKSMCSHHSLPFHGHAYVAYIPGKSGIMVGLSKLNRVVEWFSRRPQIQEGLSKQIHDYLRININGNGGVAVMIKAAHMCTCLRGVKHDSYMVTSMVSGGFKNNPETRSEFFNFVSRQ